MKQNYEVRVTRTEAVLYLAMEYGVKKANELLKTLPSRGFFPLPPYAHGSSTLDRLRSARGYADRIDSFVAYQRGRLGQPLIGSLVTVKKV